MNPKKPTFYFIGLVFILGWQLSFSQTIITGMVYDKTTKEPLPFVNVVFQHSTVGTITDYQGNYYLKTNNPKDTLIATCLGYDIQRVKILKNGYQELDFYLSETSLSIEAVVVTPGENPAFRILDSIKAYRKQNNPDRFEAYQYKTYNKLRLDINNIDKEFKDRRLLKQFQFIFENMDTSEVFGKNYLPALISESVSRFYYQKSPSVEKEVIEAFQISGIENNTMSQFSGKMYQRLNIYDNFITMFEPGFISPIADFGRLYYKYILEDSASLDGNWCYKVAFKPKRTQERTFFGYFWVADTSWAIKKIQLRVSSDVNINFMNDLVAINEYSQINDSTWFLSKEDLFIDFNIADKSFGFFGRKQATYSDITLDEPIPDEITRLMTNTYVMEDSLERNENYWQENRQVDLDEEEANIYVMVDSVKQVPAFKTMYSFVELLFDYYYVVGNFELGPYYTFYSHNPIEGHRIKFGGRTSNNFSTKYRFGGHLAYGFSDQRFKYGLNTEIMFDRDPRRRLELTYNNDMRQLGKSQNAFMDDNILETMLRRRPNYKLTMMDQYTAIYEHEWFQGFSNTFNVTHFRLYSSPYVQFQELNPQGDPISKGSIATTEVTISTHFAYKEKFLLGKFERKSLGSIYPVLDIDFTYAPKDALKNKYEYYKLRVQVTDKIETNPFGYTRYLITAGKIFGQVPYPFLELHEGNETYAYDVYSYNMMNYYEFVSDQYASIFAEQHLQGFFLNKIPLLRRLEWREVASAKFLVGGVSDKHQSVMAFPDGLKGLTVPYGEAGIGIENILKLFRVEALWRLSYLDNPDIQKFSARVMMQLTF